MTFTYILSLEEKSKVKNLRCACCGIKLNKELWDGVLYTIHPFEKEVVFCLRCKTNFGMSATCSCGEKYSPVIFLNALALQTVCNEVGIVYSSNIRSLAYSYLNKSSVCLTCMIKEVKVCKHCSKILLEGSICQTCKSKIFTCLKCGKECFKEHPYEKGVCLLCQPVIYEKKSWNFKATLRFKSARRRPAENQLYLGIELEIPCVSDERARELTHKLMAKIEGRTDPYYIKHDGTIMPGFELVFQPMDWAYYQSYNWDWVFELEKYRNKEHPSQGMHIHLSRCAFSELHSFKFTNFVYNNLPLVTFINERPPNNYCGVNLDLRLTQAILEEPGCVSSDNIDVYNFKRRRLVNHLNTHTIELRGFQSNLRKEHFHKNMEFAYALFQYTKDSGIAEYTEGEFLDWVKQRGGEFPNLFAFLAAYRRDAWANYDLFTPLNAIYRTRR